MKKLLFIPLLILSYCIFVQAVFAGASDDWVNRESERTIREIDFLSQIQIVVGAYDYQ